MKISASIYSNKGQGLKETIHKLDESGVDLLHVDCNDDIKVMSDIAELRAWTKIPVDLHIITRNPSKYYELLENTPVEYVTFQHEDLEEKLVRTKNDSTKWGLAITTNTPVSVFDDYEDIFDFILIMATVPGQSGGVFDKHNFQKIREFRRNHPEKKVHVDGGVNAEVSFILRNMGVYASVSGSFLFKQNSVGQALLQLQSREIDSEYHLKDFMISIENSPVLQRNSIDFNQLLRTIDNFKMGFCIITNDDGSLYGICSNADIRKALIKNHKDIGKTSAEEAININPKYINMESTVKELLTFIKGLNFPILYLPIVDNNNIVTGSIAFQNLIKGEL